jgi:hypothetical protein
MRESKRCPACGEVKAREAFTKNRSAKDGLGTYCKPCHNHISRENAERLYGGRSNFHLKRRYGIDSVDVAWLRMRQNDLCAICEFKPAEHVDHDHATGDVRGLLCFNCNVGLGMFGDDVDVIRKAIEYLRSGGVSEAAVPYVVNA